MKQIHDASRLHAELAQLRSTLRDVAVPEPDEAVLRAQFRARSEQAKRAAVEHGGGSRRFRIAAAAAVVLAIGAGLAAVVLRDHGASEPAVAEAPPLGGSPVVGAFQPLPAPGLPPSDAYSVVRVRIPLSALAVVPGTAEGGTIEADLLVGEDGLARAIRFNEADALLVSVADQ